MYISGGHTGRGCGSGFEEWTWLACGGVGAMLVAAMFVAALTVPDAFGSHGVLFGVAFLIVNVMHLTLYGSQHFLNTRARCRFAPAGYLALSG
jgi:hypothetical protein